MTKKKIPSHLSPGPVAACADETYIITRSDLPSQHEEEILVREMEREPKRSVLRHGCVIQLVTGAKSYRRRWHALLTSTFSVLCFFLGRIVCSAYLLFISEQGQSRPSNTYSKSPATTLPLLAMSGLPTGLGIHDQM